MSTGRKYVKDFLAPLGKAGLIKIVEIGHDGFWEIELLVDDVSEIEHVLGSLALPPLSPPSPPSQTLPPPPTSAPHPPTPSYVAAPEPAPTRASTHEAVLVNKKPHFHKHLAVGKSKALGGENLDLFEAPKFSLSSKDMQTFMDVWNGTIVLPKISSLRGREHLVRDAMKDEFFRENYREGIRKVAASKFCRGHNRQGTGTRPWKATVEWFLQPATLPKVIEGRYDSDQEPELTPAEQKFTQETL